MVVQSAQKYQLKELAGLELKKIEDFEFTLTHFRISEDFFVDGSYYQNNIERCYDKYFDHAKGGEVGVEA